MSDAQWACRRCSRPETARIPFKPWTGALGRRIQDEICLDCWNEWTGLQTRIINEYRVNVLDPEQARALRNQMEIFLGMRPPEGDEIAP